MKNVTTATRNAIDQNNANTVDVMVLAEWNQNAMYRTVVTNTPSEDTNGYNIDLFPIESISSGNRPDRAGICKAVVAQASIESTYHTSVPSARYYLPDEADIYKYWQSPVPSDASNVLTSVAPQVIYVEDNDVSGAPVNRTVRTNKIRLLVENTFATPTEFEVQVKTTPAAVWTKVADQTVGTPSSNGVLELWYNGSGWTTTKNLDNLTTLHGVRLVVTKLNKPSSYFNLIELGLRLELNVSADVAAMTGQMSMGEVDFITPLGTVSSNTGQITLFNDTRRYTNDNPDSILYNLLDKGVKLTGFYLYENNEYIQDFVGYSESWEESDSDTVVNLVDQSRMFQDLKPKRVLYEDMPVQEIVWRLCDLVGFTSYNVTAIDASADSVIGVFWTDAEATVWETFQSLSKATQTAIYFDSYGILQIKTKEAAFNPNKTSVGTITRDGTGSVLPNIINLQEQKQYEANKVKVSYRPTDYSQRKYYVTPFEEAWAPETDIVLRASEIVSPMTATSDSVYLAQADAETWPYKGTFQIEGEWIDYEGKEYTYNVNGVNTRGTVKSLEEQQAFDKLTAPEAIHLNRYTGRMFVTQRGASNTEPQAHSNVPNSEWKTVRQKGYGSSVVSSGTTHNKSTSSVTVANTGSMNDYTYYYRGATSDAPLYYLGTRMKIDKSTDRNKVGGLFFNAGGGVGTGYFVEVTASVMFSGKKRTTANEVIFYSMKANGTKKVLGGGRYVQKDKSKGTTKKKKKQGKENTTTVYNTGARMAIVQDNYFDLDIRLRSGTVDYVDIYGNGNFLFSATITTASGWKQTPAGVWGLYARGQSKATFDMAYGLANTGTLIPSTGVQYFDRIDQGYRANQWMVDIAYESRMVTKRNKRKSTQVLQRYNQRFYDEFGAIAHEIRDFDVNFELDEPVVQSRLYLSNLSQCVPLSYSADNSSARFTLANTSRVNAVLSGDDELTSSGQGTINQKLFVYGRPAKVVEDQSIERKDDNSIRRRGIIDIEYDTPWIQSKGAAESLGNWLVNNWRTSDSVISVEIWGNPVYELGDVVTVISQEINGTYYITEITNSFENGVSTSLTLKKT